MHSITPITGGNYTRCLRAIKAEGVALPAAVAVVGEQRFVLNDAESRDGKLPLHGEETLRERGSENVQLSQVNQSTWRFNVRSA